MCHHARLIFVLLVETGFQHVGQTDFELLTSGDLPTSSSQSAAITGVSHHARPRDLQFLRRMGREGCAKKLTLDTDLKEVRVSHLAPQAERATSAKAGVCLVYREKSGGQCRWSEMDVGKTAGVRSRRHRMGKKTM